ncbi:MAG TPA: hypothetical protein VFY73_03290 [Ideonella sp.]|uniref:hypothetical protein n=1 Tax=Ideonella sp. TaxID=1929293 RepID=UPI002E366A87|nr:hypothetical protein [Ideonella sp.]HEX5683038.1 hypothetical protein [Ideonella sp.]
MLPFLSSIISAALPVAKIAAQVLPQILGGDERSRRADADAPPPVPPISNTLIDFVGDERQQKVFAANNTTRTLAVTFQNNVEVGGVIGVQSETFELPPRNAADVTADVEVNSDSGTVSANYADGINTAAGPGARLAILSLPFVSALAFSAFGGKIGFERSTVEESGKRFDRWTITSDSNLKSVNFAYKTQNGQDIHFKADLEKSLVRGGVRANIYQVDTDAVGLTTGMLSNFNVTMEADEASFAALLSKRQLTTFENLPGYVRARLRNA